MFTKLLLFYLLLCHCEHLFLHFYFNIAHDVVTGSIIFVYTCHFQYTFTHAHTRTHTPTCTISAHKVEWRETNAGAWLEGAEVAFCKRQRVRPSTCIHKHTHFKYKLMAHRDLTSSKIRVNRASSQTSRLFHATV